MAKVVRATAAGQPGIPEGFPILLWETMVIIEPAFLFLLELATIPGRAHATETVRTYAEHLHDWFDALEQSGLEWHSVDERIVAGYRNRMLQQPSAHTGRPYARSTINDRVRTVCRFYEWAHQLGLVKARPFHFVDVRVWGRSRESMLMHVRGRPSVVSANALTLAEQERLPRPLRVDQLRLLFAQMELPYRLMAEWALATGMRRKELCGLRAVQVPSTAHLDADNHPLIGVALSITKGDQPRTVYPPIRLVDRTHHYMEEERVPLIRACRRRRADYRAPSALFLNSRGGSVTRARLTAVFQSAFRVAGLTGTGHWLRHTFAMTMLVRLQSQAQLTPDINPLKTVQVLLGHRSIQSTAIYLRCVELHEAEVARSLDYLYGEAIGNGR